VKVAEPIRKQSTDSNIQININNKIKQIKIVKNEQTYFNNKNFTFKEDKENKSFDITQVRNYGNFSDNNNNPKSIGQVEDILKEFDTFIKDRTLTPDVPRDRTLTPDVPRSKKLKKIDSAVKSENNSSLENK